MKRLPVYPALLFLIMCFAHATKAQVVKGVWKNKKDLKSVIDSAEKYKKLSYQEFKKRLRSRKGLYHNQIAAADLRRCLLTKSAARDSNLDISDCYVTGKLDLSNQKLPYSISAENCYFDDDVILDHTSMRTFGFENSIFRGNISAELATFRDKVWIDGCYLFKGIDFGNCTFLRSVSLFSDYFDNEDGDANTFVSFTNATVQDEANFSQSKFHVALDYDNTVFSKQALYNKAEFYYDTNFDHTHFNDIVSFQQAQVGGVLIFTTVTFQKSSFFQLIDTLKPDPDGRNTNSIYFYNVEFRGKLFFDGTHLRSVAFPLQKKNYFHDAKSLQQDYDGLICLNIASFKNVIIDSLNLNGAEFQGFADLSGSTFRQYLNCNDAVFKDKVSFYKTVFPERDAMDKRFKITGVSFDNVRFLDDLELDYDQIVDWRLQHNSARVWANLEHEFKRTDNLPAQNQAAYEKEKLSPHTPQWLFSYSFWGFGFRPMRIILWMALVQLIFTIIYWYNVDTSAVNRRRHHPHLIKARFIWDFSRKTALTLSFGPKHSNTILFKSLTFLHALLMKVMAIFFLIALANVSPLLHEVFTKILPG